METTYLLLLPCENKTALTISISSILIQTINFPPIKILIGKSSWKKDGISDA
jgi:hypothetical protein